MNPAFIIKNEEEQNSKKENKQYKGNWLSTPFVPRSLQKRENREVTEVVLVYSLLAAHVSSAPKLRNNERTYGVLISVLNS